MHPWRCGDNRLENRPLDFILTLAANTHTVQAICSLHPRRRPLDIQLAYALDRQSLNLSIDPARLLLTKVGEELQQVAPSANAGWPDWHLSSTVRGVLPAKYSRKCSQLLGAMLVFPWYIQFWYTSFVLLLLSDHTGPLRFPVSWCRSVGSTPACYFHSVASTRSSGTSSRSAVRQTPGRRIGFDPRAPRNTTFQVPFEHD